MQVTITIPTPPSISRQWRWALLALFVILPVAMTAPQSERAEAGVPQQLNITNLGRYALPKTCFQVENGFDFVPLFHVCDNDFQGAPQASSVCAGDGVCQDENPADGAVVVTVLPGNYVISESKPPPQHSPPVAAQPCNASSGPCALTFINTPHTRPWHPWDLVGGGTNGLEPDGFVRVNDILDIVQHYFDDKPLPTPTPTP